jgi:hypothetical protein
MIDVAKLGGLRITEGANKLEAQYAEEHRRNGVRLRRRYYRGSAMKSTGGGASHTGVSGPAKIPHKNQKPYNPNDHARTVYAGGRKRQAVR